jgi:hypothetical protein
MAHVNYFGKRGSFVQCLGARLEPSLAGDFTIPLDTWQANGGGTWGTLQPLDDLGETHSADLFDRINTYGDKPIELLEHRRPIPTVIPYELQATSRGCSHYRRIR